MADPKQRLSTNVEGDFYVDSTCIDCGTCRWMAPDVFDRADSYSRVHRQPTDDITTLASLRSLVACPTGSIGTTEAHDIARVSAEFPVRIADNVYHCGFHHRDSFGAASYFVARPEGNVLIDSPRFSGPLIKRLEELGGIRYLFLTHQDDVADHEKFAERFGCERILHAADVTSSTRNVEIQPQGTAPLSLTEDLLIIPVPGHTRGSCCLLYGERFLFSGDHLAWNRDMHQLYAFRTACWFDWPTQVESMKNLADHRFEHVLPGHGAPCQLDRDAMNEQMRACLEWMVDVS